MVAPEVRFGESDVPIYSWDSNCSRICEISGFLREKSSDCELILPETQPHDVPGNLTQPHYSTEMPRESGSSGARPDGGNQLVGHVIRLGQGRVTAGDNAISF